MTRGRVGQDYEGHKDNEGRWRTRRGDLEKRDEMDVDAEINRDRCRNQRIEIDTGRKEREEDEREREGKENRGTGIEMGQEMCT